MNATYYIDVIAKRDGTTFGFIHEQEAESYAVAYRNALTELRERGWNIVKARRVA